VSHRTTKILLAVASSALIAALAAAPALAGGPKKATLEARANLPAEATAPAPFPGVPDTEPAPAPGSTQPVGGFSALLDAPGKDTYWAMPDNGFGSKTNSHSFLLRVYRVRADFETAKGGDGDSRSATGSRCAIPPSGCRSRSSTRTPTSDC
jgi:glycerophosphoryl diester phosphodiesterase